MELNAVSDSWQDGQLGGLPRELWMVILERVFALFVSGQSHKQYAWFFKLCLVGSWWSKMVYESVTELNDRRFAVVTDDILPRFVSLQDLTLSDPHRKSAKPLTNAGLRTATNLTRLDIKNGSSISDAGIVGLLKLTTLAPSVMITGNGLENLTNLTTLHLNYIIDDTTIVKLTKLTTLVSWDSEMTADGLKALTNLTSLSINSPKYNFDDAIVQLTNLKFLNLYGNAHCSVSDNGLKGLLNLTHLNLSDDSYISDTGIQNLTNLKTLILVNAGNQVTDDGLLNLVNLSALSIAGNRSITDTGIVGLTKLSSLVLDWRSAGVTDHGISTLVSLTTLALNNVITNAGVSLLTNLTKLDYAGNRLVTKPVK